VDSGTYSVAISSALSGLGGLNKFGAGTLSLLGANTFSGTAIVSSGFLQVGTGSTSGALSANVNLLSAGTLLFNRSDASSYGGALSGAGAVQKLGTGDLTLSGLSTNTGSLTVNTGNLILSGTLGSGQVNIANGAVSSGNTKTVSLATGGVANSVSAVTIFSGVAGNSTLTIGASTGNTTVSYTANSIVAIANTSGTALSVTGNITGGNILTGGILRTAAIVVASLPTAAGAAAGARSFVTDATAATFGTIVAGGGANAVPVWSDGTNWKIG
jgi:autotransporter-associated beta strand protein